MTQIYAGVGAVPLSVAVWLATDNYDYNKDENTISATTLIKPLRQIILPSRIPPGTSMPNLMDMVKNRIGSAIHDAIERAWTHNHVQALKNLGYPPGMIRRVKINPKREDLVEGDIDVYFEQRLSKKVGKWTVTGKFDTVVEGAVEDYKSTSTYVYVKQVNAKKFAQQGSLYRWLDPVLIYSEQMHINHIFTDWKASEANRSTSNYPPSPVLRQTFDLASLDETQGFVERKLALIDKYWDAPEAEIPYCSDEDLWRSEPQWKYYKNPQKTSRSTKNFDTAYEANLRFVEDGSVGLVREVPGEATACKYCPAFDACSQKDALIAAGDLSM